MVGRGTGFNFDVVLYTVRKTATVKAKMTTIASVASASVAPWLDLLFVLILLKIINFLFITVPPSSTSYILLNSRTQLVEYLDPRVLFSSQK